MGRFEAELAAQRGRKYFALMEIGKEGHPRRPANLPMYAEACLQALVAHGLGDRISLGGAIGLMHYLEYRPTHDVDAWWTGAATSEDQRQVVAVIQKTLTAAGSVKTRTWGDVVSIELNREGTGTFSFQIARRSAQLESSAPAPWISVLLDSFSDLVASKMTALVERGAPRDFRDLFALCQAELATPQQCWDLWRRRQQLAGSDTDHARARLAVETHLARIEQHRPLEQISDGDQKAEAQKVRSWFVKDFLEALDEKSK